jgi:spermidine/putrescine transport system permease protein
VKAKAETRRAAQRRSLIARQALVLPSVLLLVAMIVAPLVTLGLFSFFTSVHPLSGFTGEQYATLLHVGIYLRLLVKTLYVATLVTAIALAIAWPAGWIVSRLSQSRQLLVVTLVILPYLTSYLLLIYAMFVVIAPRGPLMTFLSLLRIANGDSSILYTPRATIVMLVYESIPIMVLVTYAGSDRISNSLLEAARSLGAGRFNVFRRVILPLSLPSLVTGSLLVFVPALGVFAESAILGGPNGVLIGNVINDQINVVNNQPFAAVLSFLLLGTVVLVAVAAWTVLRFVRRDDERGHSVEQVVVVQEPVA